MTFNWSWISTDTSTAKASQSIRQTGGSVFSFRQPSSGQISSTQLNAAIKSIANNIQSLWGLWATYSRPVLDSLPAGGRDTRWNYSPGKGLPSKIDALTYGIQGSTLFVFNDATSSIASGRYWYTDQNRPKTIAEKFEDVYDAISDISTSVTSSSSVDLNPLWEAIGHRYQDSSLVSVATSLDARTGTLEDYITQLSDDLYGLTDGYTTYNFGTPLPYSVARNIDKLLKLHNVSGGWGANPNAVSHSGISPAAHTHPYTEVTSTLVAGDIQARVGPATHLDNDIKRLRYEIQQTRGSANWYSDVVSPLPGNPVASLYTHINYVGSGTASTSNPHGIDYTDTGADTVFSVVRSFTGMSSNLDSSPTYTSTNWITQGNSLEAAIGELDTALNDQIGTVVNRLDYTYDRSATDEHIRAVTPITINHNMGAKPIVQVLDATPDDYGPYGAYTSEITGSNVVHLTDNALEIWTSAAVVEVILIG